MQNSNVAAESPAIEARDLASALMSDWPRDVPLDAGVVLAEYPELAGIRSVVLDLANEEYCQRLERGEWIDAIEFARRFPQHEHSVLRLLQLHALFEPGDSQHTPWPRAGEDFGRFQLIEEIGRGAFSRVYHASDRDVGGRRVVLKICTHAGGEADLLGRLDHPAIVPFFSAGRGPGGYHYLCMPDFGRLTLANLIEFAFAGQWPPVGPQIDAALAADRNEDASGDWFGASATYVDEVVAIGADLAEALAYAHRFGIRHGDVKPSNVLIRSGGRGMLLDFNLATVEESSRVGGTLSYMAPEALAALHGGRGTSCPDPRWDIFSLGVTLYQAFSGQLPFQGEPTLNGQRQSRGDAVPPLESLNPRVDSRLAALIHRCLASDPAARPPSAESLAESLRSHSPPRGRTRRWLRTHRREALVTMAIGIAGIAGGAVWSTRRDPFVVRQLALGRERLAAGDWDNAISYYDEALRFEADCAQALFERGRCRMHLKQFIEASTDFRLCASTSQDGRASACLAHSILRVNNYYDEAIRNGLRACDQEFATAEVHNNIGVCHLMLGYCAPAREHLEIALDLRPRFPEAIRNLASVDTREAVREGRPPDLRMIRRALAIGPPAAELHLDAAYAYCQAARCAPSSSEREEHLRRASAHSEAAIAGGFGPDRLRGVSTLVAALRGDDRIRPGRLIPPQTAPGEALARTVDPLLGRDLF